MSVPSSLPDVGGLRAALLRDRVRLVNWTLAAGLTGFAFWAVLFPLTNTDIWWHLSAGREMVREGWFLYRDPFSYAPEGARWIDLHWLFQILAYAVHSAAGVPGLVLAKALVFAAACAVLLKVAGLGSKHGRETAPVAVALLAAAVYFIRFQILVRPGVLSLLYLASFILVVETYRRERRPRVLWFLPVIQVLWTNTQGTFVLGPVTLLCYVLGDAAAIYLARVRSVRPKVISFEATLGRGELRTLAKFFGLTCAACLVSPYGPWGLLLPFVLYSRIDPGLSGVYAWNVSENMPTWAILQTAPARLSFFVWFTVIAVASFVLARRRASLPRFALFAAFFYLGMIAERNVSLYLLVLVPVTVINCSSALDDVRGRDCYASFARWARPAAAAAAAVTILAAAIGVARSQARDPSRLGLAPFRYPTEAAEMLLTRDFDGNVFNSVRYGGYLIWRLFSPTGPRKKVFIDGRLVIRSREQFREYLDLLDDAAGRGQRCGPDFAARWGEFRTSHQITRAVLPTALSRRYLGLVRFLYRDPDWRLTYADGACALFAYDPERLPVRRQTGEGSGRDVGQHLEVPTLRGLDLARRDAVAEIAARLDKTAAQRWNGNVYVREQARLNLCGLLLYLGHYDRAAEVAEALSGGTSSPGPRRYLARCRYFQGRLDEARRLSESLLAEDPEDTDSLNLLGRIRLEDGDVKGALECFGDVVRIDPYNRCAGEAIDRIEAGLIGERGGDVQ